MVVEIGSGIPSSSSVISSLLSKHIFLLIMLLNRLAAGCRDVAVLPRFLALGLRGKDRSLLVSEENLFSYLRSLEFGLYL